MFAFVAALAAGAFAGAAVYIAYVEHWARLEAGPAVALAQFRPGFPRARSLQASLASIGGIAALLAWLTGSGAGWLLVGLLLLGVVGYTLSRITPVYEQLLDPRLSPDDPRALELLTEWGDLHRVRAFAGALAFFVALLAL